MTSEIFSGLDLESRPRLELAALIDMSFLMLIFFMVAATLQPQEADLPIHLPRGISAENAGAIHMERMVVRVDDHGTIRLNRELLSGRPGQSEVDVLKERLTRYAAVAAMSGSKPHVVIHCSGSAAEQQFIDVLGASHAAGIQTISVVDD